MKKKYSVKQLCEFIWSLEQRHELFSWKESGVFIWPLLRFKLYYLLSEKIELFEKAHPYVASKNEKVVLLLKAFYLLLFKNPLKLLKKKDFLVVRHDRKVEGIDLYSDQLTRELGKKAFISDTIEESFKTKEVISFDAYKALAYLLYYLSKPLIHYKKKHANLIIIEKEIEKEFNIRLDLQNLYQNQFYKFKLLKKIYRTIFSTIKPKKVFIVGAYFRQEIVAAAELENIPVVELQHGVITEYHLGYSYPGQPEIPYFPNELWCFGRYWYESVNLPKNVKTQVIGAPYVLNLANKMKAVSRLKNSILFTSQGVIGPELFDFAYNTATKNSDYKITFRLHPSESLGKYTSCYKKLMTLPNFEISHRKPNIFELISMHEFQVGVFSTTLFEGLALGTKTILINLPGIEYMQPLIDSKKVDCVDSVEELILKINDAKESIETEQYYAPAISKFNSIL